MLDHDKGGGSYPSIAVNDFDVYRNDTKTNTINDFDVYKNDTKTNTTHH